MHRSISQPSVQYKYMKLHIGLFFTILFVWLDFISGRGDRWMRSNDQNNEEEGSGFSPLELKQLEGVINKALFTHPVVININNTVTVLDKTVKNVRTSLHKLKKQVDNLVVKYTFFTEFIKPVLLLGIGHLSADPRVALFLLIGVFAAIQGTRLGGVDDRNQGAHQAGNGAAAEVQSVLVVHYHLRNDHYHLKLPHSL